MLFLAKGAECTKEGTPDSWRVALFSARTSIAFPVLPTGLAILAKAHPDIVQFICTTLLRGM